MAATSARAMRARRWLAAAGAVTFTAGVAAAPVHADTAKPAVTCTYTFSAWTGGFTANVHIANSGPAINGWTVHWTFPVPTDEVTAWSSSIAVRNGIDVTATNVSYNAPIPSGGSTDFGWNARAASTTVPTDLTINGTPC